MTFSAGDVVGMVFAWPGNDTTFLVVKEVDGRRVRFFDLFFEFEGTVEKLENLWLATEKDLDSRFGKNGDTVTVRELARRHKSGEPLYQGCVPVATNLASLLQPNSST